MVAEMNEPVTSLRPGVGERLSQLVRVPTVAENGDKPYEDFRKLIRGLYPNLHKKLKLREITDRGLLFYWPGRVSDNQPVLLMAHWDVVPAVDGDGWTYPPFEGKIADGKVWGRGTLDDKGAFCVLVEAVENLLAVDFVPERDIYLFLGGNEETYGFAAMAAAEEFKGKGIVPWLVLDEGGAVVDAPIPMIPTPAAMVGVAEKGIATIELLAIGAGGHASAPGKHLATNRIARAILRLEANPFPARLGGGSRDMFAELSKQSTGKARWLTKFVAGVPWLSAKVLARMGGDAAAMVHTTLAATMLSGGTAANVLPNKASAILNIRIAPFDSLAGVVRHIEKAIADPAVQVIVHESAEPTPESPRTGAQIELIAAAVAASYDGLPTVPYVQVSATDARNFHRFAPAVYRFAPLEMDAAQRATIHGVDERVSIASLEKGVQFYQELIHGIPGEISGN